MGWLFGGRCPICAKGEGNIKKPEVVRHHDISKAGNYTPIIIGSIVAFALIVIGVIVLGAIVLLPSRPRTAEVVQTVVITRSAEGTPIIITATLEPMSPVPHDFTPTSVLENSEESTGSHIVFTCFISGIDQICIMNADGSSQRQLTFDSATSWFGSFLPGGQTIIFSKRVGEAFEIYTMDTNGGNLHFVSKDIHGNYAPDVSPDGRRVIFASAIGRTPQDIWLMGIDGSNPTPLTQDPSEDLDPAWSPDGTQVLFASNRSGNLQLHVMNADGTNVRQLTTMGIGGRPDWSPDGRFIAFYGGQRGSYQIYIMNADETNIRPLTDAGSNKAPSFSPDSKWIAYTSNIDGDDEIFIMRIDGSDKTQLTFNDYADWQPRWEP